MKKYVPRQKSTHAKIRNAKARSRNTQKISQNEAKTLRDLQWMVRVDD